MLRYTVTLAAALAIMSGAALANEINEGQTSKTVVMHPTPNGVGTSRTIIKRHVNRYGNLVTKRKTIHEGIAGSTVSRSRTETDPYAGGSVTRSQTTIER